MSGRAQLAVVAVLVVVMVALHQDSWNWTDKRLVFGVLPVGLAWHIGFSILSSVVMFTLVRVMWPRDLEEDGPGDNPMSGK